MLPEGNSGLIEEEQMKNTKRQLFKLISVTFMLLILQVPLVSAANIYVDKTLSANCTLGNYSTTSRTCTGSSGKAYKTIQEAINACAVGDTIYMRGGTYGAIGINIPESKNGTA